MVFFQTRIFKSQILGVLAFLMLCQVFYVPKASAIEVSIPNVETKVSDEFILESIAKLDDFIEDIRAKERLRGVETVGFVTATMVQLGTITGILLDQFVFKKTLVSGVVDEVKKVSTAGRVGKLPFEIGTFTRRWFVGTGAANIAAASKEKSFTVHVQDLALFREILTSVREKQAQILFRVWKDTSKSDLRYREKLANMETLIREKRPSFKSVYEPCSSNPSGYKRDMAIHVYSNGLKDYFTVLLVTPAAVSKQVDAGFISPTLKAYINQEVLPWALNKCFKIQTSGSGETVSGFRKFVLGIPLLGAGVLMIEDIGANEHHRFIAQLFAVDTVSRFVVVAAVYSIFRFKDVFRHTKTPGPEVVGKFKNTWLGDTMKWVQTFFSKISPTLVAKVVVTSQIVISSYSLYALKREYDEAQEVGQSRRTTEEFKRLAKKYFHDRALAQIQELKNLLTVKDIDMKDRAAIEKEIRNWRLIEVEFAS